MSIRLGGWHLRAESHGKLGLRVVEDPQNRTAAAERWCSFRWFAAGLALLLALRFNGVLTGLEAFTLRDFSMFGYPLAAHLQRSLFAGELPLWNPLNQAGTPFLAEWNTMVLYPPMLLAALLPLSWSLSVFCIAHQFLGGLGAWRLAHRFTGDGAAAALAGIAYAGHGLVQNSLMWPNNSAALGLMPWVLLAVEAGCRRRGGSWFGAALTGGLQMLTGGPEVILLTWMTAAGLVTVQAWHQCGATRETTMRLLAFAGLMVAVALLAAVQLLPFLELLRNSHRDAGFGGDHWAASPMAWANLMVPLYGTIEAPGRIFFHQGQGWTHSYYAGMTVLALALTAPFLRRDRRLWFAAAGVLVFLLISMGDAGGLYPLIGGIPPFSLLRFPIKFLIPLTVLLPVLAAIGFARLRRMHCEPGWSCDPRRCAYLLAIVVLAWLAAFVAGLANDRISQSDYVTNSVVRLSLFALTAGPLFMWVRGKDARWLPVLVIGVVTLDLQIHQANLAPTVQARQYTARIPALDELGEALAAGPSRAALSSLAVRNLNANSLASPDDTLLLNRLGLAGNGNLIDGLPKVNGFYSLYLKNYREVQAVFHAADDEPSKPLADFLGVSHVMHYAKMFNWRPRAGAMPLITGGQQPVFVADEQSLARLAATNFNPRTEVLLPVALRDTLKVGPSRVTVSEATLRPHRIRFVADAATNTLAVIAQADHPAWRATVNGSEVPIMRANHAFQSVELPAGRSEVILAYHDRSFRLGLLLSALTFCAGLGGCLHLRRR